MSHDSLAPTSLMLQCSVYSMNTHGKQSPSCPHPATLLLLPPCLCWPQQRLQPGQQLYQSLLPTCCCTLGISTRCEQQVLCHT